MGFSVIWAIRIDVEDITGSCRGSWCGVIFNLNRRRWVGVLCVDDIQKGRGREGKGKGRSAYMLVDSMTRKTEIRSDHGVYSTQFNSSIPPVHNTDVCHPTISDGSPSTDASIIDYR